MKTTNRRSQSNPKTPIPPVLSQQPWWQRDGFLSLLLVLVTTAAYFPAWNGQPIWDDDQHHLYVTHFSGLAGLARMWFQPFAIRQYYPLVGTVFWIEHQLWGDSPLGHHLVNILLHTSVALILWRILRRLEIPGAPLAAALFALHPVQVETVAWISEIKNTLSGVCCLGAALFYLKFDQNRRWMNYGLAAVLFVLALVSKTVVATLPGALLVVFWWKRGKLSWKHDVIPMTPFVALGVGFGILSAWMEQNVVGAADADFRFSFVERGLIAGRAIWFYLGKLVWPSPLIFIYPRWQISQSVWWQYLYPAAALGLLFVLWRLRLKWRGPLAAFLLFGGTLFPALGFFNVYPFRFSFVADHFQYLACIGPLTLAAAGIAIGFSRLNRSYAYTRILQPLCGLILVAVLGSLVWQQSGMYTDLETLWKRTIENNPDCWVAYGSLGWTAFQQGREDEAIYDLQRALSIKSDNADAHNSLGLALQQKGQMNAAIAHFEEARRIRPDYAAAYNNIGTIALQKGELDKAIEHFQRTLELNPDFADVHFNLGLALLQKGQPDAAIAHFQKALAIKPADAEAHYDLATALVQNGKASEAIAQFRETLALVPDNTDTLNDLAWVLATSSQSSLRNGSEAVQFAKHANQLTHGEDVDILRTLAAAYAEAGQFTDALATAELALSRNKGSPKPDLTDKLQREIRLYQMHQSFH